MCSTPLARQNGIERRHEFVGHRAAQAAVGQFDDVFLGAGGVAAAFENFAVDADIAELVDDDGEAAALRIGEHVADQRRFAGAEKAGDDGAGNARERTASWVDLFKADGGNAGDQAALEIAPAGRATAGCRPAAPARRRAPATRASAHVCIEAAEHVGPRAVAAQRGARAARAIGETAQPPHLDFRAFGRAFGRVGKQRAGTRLAVDRPACRQVMQT